MLPSPSLSRSAPFSALVLAALALVGLAFGPPPAAAQEVVFLAGPKDHGWPGRHEYEKDLRALAWSLENARNLDGVTTRVHVGQAPRDLAAYEDAAVLVINSSSDRTERETHPLFPPAPETDYHGYDEATTAFLDGLDSLITARHIGVVVLHYATWVENWRAREAYMDWLGGMWVQIGSKNPTDTWTMAPQNTSHPVNNGVRPWTYRDEVFCRFFLPPDPRRTDLLLGTPAESPVGPQVASWAYQRDDGGRGFVMGGVDFHDNLHEVEDYRRFLLNGIVWAAGMDVPASGVQAPALPPDEAD